MTWGAWRREAPPLPAPSPSLSGRGYMAATAAKREPPRRRCRPQSRRPEPTLGAVRGPRTPSMSRRSPVSVCVYVCGARRGRLGRAPRRARRRSRLPPPLCVTLRRPPFNKGAFVLPPARPGLAGGSPRGAGGPGSPRGAGGAAGAPLPPVRHAPRRQRVPAAPARPPGARQPLRPRQVRGFEARPGGLGGAARSRRWRGVSPAWRAAGRKAPASPPPSQAGDSASADSAGQSLRRPRLRLRRSAHPRRAHTSPARRRAVILCLSLEAGRAGDAANS